MRFQVFLPGVLALSMAGSVEASTMQPETISVHVRRKLNVRENVHISFQSGGRLPEAATTTRSWS